MSYPFRFAGGRGELSCPLARQPRPFGGVKARCSLPQPAVLRASGGLGLPRGQKAGRLFPSSGASSSP